MSLNELLRAHRFSFKKSLGQNFIHDPMLLQRIVDAAQVGPTDSVIEIGTGAGSLTAALAEQAHCVISLEVDRRLEDLLEERFQDQDHVHILFQDALKSDLDALAEHYAAERYKVVANLPYYITTPLMMHILEDQVACDLAVLMMQKEVAERISSEPNQKSYGAISVMVQYYADVDKVFHVARGAFTPAPEVDSTVVRLRPRPYPELAVCPTFLRDVVRAAFGQRRKKIRNALGSLKMPKATLDAALAACEIDPDRRGETLSVTEYVCLSNALRSKEEGDAL